MAGWKPKYKKLDETLTAEFPEYIRDALLERLGGEFMNDIWGPDFVVAAPFLEFQLVYRADYAWREGRQGSLQWNSVKRTMIQSDTETFTDFLDFIVHLTGKRRLTEQRGFDGKSVATLQGGIEHILSAGGSKWRVGEDEDGIALLVERVPEVTQNAVGALVQTRSTAAKLLHRAWVNAYGTRPSASAALADAVKAVETALLPLFPDLKNSPDATLGAVFSRLAHAQLPLRVKPDKVTPGKAIEGWLRLLWNGHSDRHGSAQYKDATVEQARTAILIALPLISMVEGGHLTVD